MPALNWNSPRARYWCVLCIVAAVAACYATGLRGPLLLDDVRPFIQVSKWGFPPSWAEIARSQLASRPFLALTLAANHALSGSDLLSFHLTNVAIHILAVLFLFGLLNRTLDRPAFECMAQRHKLPLAFFLALTWAVHPLQTQAVTYLIQRGESLAGLFLLAALYFAARGWQSRRPRSRIWLQVLSMACFILGGLTKETIAVLPVLLLLYFWIFFQPSLAEFLKRSRIIVGVILTAVLVSGAVLAGRLGDFYHFALPFGPLEYLANQGRVILHYLSLALWPQNLCFDYLWPVEAFSRVAPQAVVVGGLLLTTCWLVYKRSPLGFFAGFFFLTLALTSSLLPLRDICVEHRMYLPLAGFLSLAGLGLYQGLARLKRVPGLSGHGRIMALAMDRTAVVLAILLVCGLGVRTALRNLDYAAGELTMWQDVLEKQPGNPRAQATVGRLLAARGKPVEAIGHLRLAFQSRGLLTIKDLTSAGDLLAGLLFNTGQAAEALAVYQECLALEPDNLYCLLGYAQGLLNTGQYGESLRILDTALRISPNLAHALYYRSLAQAGLGRLEEAATDMRASLAGAPLTSEFDAPQRPNRGESLFHLGRFLAATGQAQEGTQALQSALQGGPPEALRKKILELMQAMGAKAVPSPSKVDGE